MILVVDDGSQFCTEIESLYAGGSEKVFAARFTHEIDDAIKKNAVDVILFGPSVLPKKAIEIAERLSVEHPDISVLMAVDDLSPDLLRDAMRAGVKDVIERGSSGDQIMVSISRALAISRRLRQSVDVRTDSADDSYMPETGKVITFFSTKGGVGKSVVSANVAVAVAEITGKRVVVLDLDLQFGDIGIMFQMTPERTIYDMIQVIERLDGDMLQGFLSGHSSGIKALLAPVRPHESDAITSTHIKATIDLLRRCFDYVIIDTPPTFNDVVLTALDESDRIYLIATMDMPSIKNTKLAIQTLKQLGYPEDVIRFILNRSDSKVWLDVDEVEQSLGMKAEIKVPSDRVIPRSVNKGVPVVIDQPKSHASKSFFDLAHTVKDMGSRDSDHLEAPGQGLRKLIRRTT